MAKNMFFVAGAESANGTRKFDMVEITTGVEQNGFVEVNFPGMNEGSTIVNGRSLRSAGRR